MKRFVSLLLVLVLAVAVAVLSACSGEHITTDRLVVYNWADYIYDYEEEFKAYYKEMTGNNISITYVTFDTNETMLTKILKGDSSVDVVCPSEYAIQKLMEQDALVQLNYFDEEKYVADFDLPDYEHNGDNVDQNVHDKIKQAFGEVPVTVNGVTENRDMTDYMVPYMYGTLGILYNKHEFDKLGIYDKEILNNANWGILFNDNGAGEQLAEELNGNILMKDSIRDSYAATVFYLLESGRLDGKTYGDKNSPLYGTPYTQMPVKDLINAVDDDLLDLCREVLTEQKEKLFGYEVDFGKDDLLKGNAMVDLAWSGDAMYAVEESWNDELEDYELSYYVPHTAGNIWFDGWVIPKTYNPDHLTAIKLFINFLNSPYVAAQNMLEIGYSSAVSPNAVRNDEDARAVLSEAYNVFDPEFWDCTDEDGNLLSAEDFDYADWDEFVEYFFDYCDEIDGSNWRYPFETAQDDVLGRGMEYMGVMRDFGANNKDVVTMWNYSRSAGISVWGMFGCTMLVFAVIVGAIALVVLLQRKRQMRVVVKRAEK